MAKAKQPAAALDSAKLQQLVQALAQYGPFALAALQRLLDVLQSKQGAGGGTPEGAGAALGGGGGAGSDLLQRVRDHQVAALAELVLAGDYLDSQGEGGGEYAPKAGQQKPQGATTQGQQQPPKA